MSNIITAKVQIRGTRPLLWHRFGPEALPLEKQERQGVAGHDPTEWRRTVIVDKTGHLYLEPTYVFATCREGGKYTRSGRSTMIKSVAATLQVADDRVYVDRWFPGYPNGSDFSADTAEPPAQDPDAPVYLDIRGVRNPSTRARNVRYRIAASPGWLVEFTIMWDKTIISRDQMEAILIDAGRLVGIGNGRAIGMGRFEVEGFEVQG